MLIWREDIGDFNFRQPYWMQFELRKMVKGARGAPGRFLTLGSGQAVVICSGDSAAIGCAPEVG